MCNNWIPWIFVIARRLFWQICSAFFCVMCIFLFCLSFAFFISSWPSLFPSFLFISFTFFFYLCLLFFLWGCFAYENDTYNVKSFAVAIVIASLAGPQWLLTEEKIRNPNFNGTINYNNAIDDGMYILKTTKSSLWILCFAQGNFPHFFSLIFSMNEFVNAFVFIYIYVCRTSVQATEIKTK